MDSETIRTVAEYSILGTLSLTIAYCALFSTVPYVKSKFSKKIKSQEELERFVSEESEKLGLNDKISSKLMDRGGAFISQEEEGYSLSVDRAHANHADIRHEVYHIYKRHQPTKVHKFKAGTPKIVISLKRLASLFDLKLKYIFREEPQAVAYSCFGIKL